MIEELVPEDLWQRVEPLLPAHPPRRSRYPGRLPVDDRTALAGIVFVLKTGISWRELPREVFGCSGVICWRRLRDWTEAGVFDAVHKVCWTSYGHWIWLTGSTSFATYLDDMTRVWFI
ncbi:transposase, partial [Actinophytocola sp.]|uniref:transposase n=1 Tax=Actinophytocola sp. TaxID=1872138 RepID=UPI00389AD501